MTLRYRSTGHEVGEVEKVSERVYPSAKEQREKALAAIEGRVDSMTPTAERVRDEAEKGFEERHPDIAERRLQRHVYAESVRMAEMRLRSGGAVTDWDSLYDAAADEVRKRAGMPTLGERERREALGDMRKARGQEGS